MAVSTGYCKHEIYTYIFIGNQKKYKNLRISHKLYNMQLGYLSEKPLVKVSIFVLK